MNDQDLPDFTAANEAREKRVIQAILDFEWDNYGLNEMSELAQDVKDDIEADGSSGRSSWAEELAKAVMAAARPLNPGDLSG